MNNYLFSQGGSGTEYTLLNFDWSKGIYSRHQRMVDFKKQNDKFVYIYNNPIDILMSFHRRGFLNEKNAVIYLQGDVSFKPPMNLEQIADNGIDYFNFQNHFDRFFSQKNKGLFIKFETLDKGWDEIEKFTGLKRKTDFVWKEKVSHTDKYSKKTIDKLNLMYSSWFEKYNKLDSIFYNN